MTAKKTTNVRTAKETMALVQEIVRYGRKEITKLNHSQNITYSEARRMVETTKYTGVTKKDISTTNKAVMCETSTTTKPEVDAQLVNEMKALIQEIKMVIGAVTEKLSKDPNNRVATSQERQAMPNRKSPGALTSNVWLLSLGYHRPHPKRKLQGTTPWWVGTWYKKIGVDQE